MGNPYQFGFGEAAPAAELQQVNAPNSHLTFYPQGRTRGAQGVVLQFDVLEREQVTLTAEVTRFPIEKGSNPSDHIIAKPDEITVDGIITNALAFGDMRDASKTFIESTAPDVRAKLELLDPPSTARPGDDARRVLHRIKEESLLCDLYLGLQSGGREYTSMAMSSCTMTRDSRVGDALKFTATFTKVRIVSSQTVAAPSRGAPTEDAGKKPPPPVSKKTEDAARGSLFHKYGGKPAKTAITKVLPTPGA